MVSHGSMDVEANVQDGQGISSRIYLPFGRPFRRIWGRSKNLFYSCVFLKGSAYAVGMWNPKKGFHTVMMAFVFLLDLFNLFRSVYNAFVCSRSDTLLNSWLCGNSSSLRPEGALQGVELRYVLNIVAYFAVLMSNIAFYWCMWKLENRSEYCMTMDKAYSAAKRSNWVTLNCTMFTFGILLLITLFWFNSAYEDKKFSLSHRVFASLSIIPLWVTLTSSWLFALITNAMKDCVSRCQAEIRNAANGTTDDIIRIHKRLCKQLSSTSEALKICYCASSVTVRCNKMLKDLNMTTDDEWQAGNPLRNRSQLALFLQYAHLTSCGFQVGDLTFGSSFAWFSTLIAICGLGLKLL
ncbi:PREDICTED: uncharacterized protein LOC107330242 [Acropora digitifera]|uniref:uncharacterized protein LOC107330242 n=1 Tax=Acropora digitifera TaxID=70779 RepID=UPI00077A9993|nr:PREDICTED: uncharacterized protein LOC107330242 [Acropora digitifera]